VKGSLSQKYRKVFYTLLTAVPWALKWYKFIMHYAAKQMKVLMKVKVSFSKRLKSEIKRVVADETTPNILSRIFGTCFKIDQLPFWSVDSVLPCMYVCYGYEQLTCSYSKCFQQQLGTLGNLKT
jgi:hypothetical protein